MNRRTFLEQSLQLLSAGYAGLYLSGCSDRSGHQHIKGNIVGANHQSGHLLRNMDKLPSPSEKQHCEVLIIGSGISGLSARMQLWKKGIKDVVLIEMDGRIGGNSTYGKNDVSQYPWGAHYLPVPDNRNLELTDFLHACGVISHFTADHTPVYNDYYLCHDPEERLYINGHWQEGLVPEFGIGDEDSRQTERFFKLVADMRAAVGSDGLDAFRIPVDLSSRDEKFTRLDNISFHQYLKEQEFTSPHLLWYLEYACKDDYGTTLERTSAWAGLHYFASRKGKGSNAGASAVLTWPEGNGFLMEQLREKATGPILRNHLAYNITPGNETISVSCYDTIAKKSTLISARHVVVATPQYINKHLLGKVQPSRMHWAAQCNYSPWMIANITTRGLPRGHGVPLSWDNVIYGQASVGYVYAGNQSLLETARKVLTFYLPITGLTPEEARKIAYTKTHEQWLQIMLSEMEYAHPGITPLIEHTDIWVWGHGMIAPAPGYIWGKERALLQQSIGERVHFAHSDLSGISIFEEGFYQGVKAANSIISKYEKQSQTTLAS